MSRKNRGFYCSYYLQGHSGTLELLDHATVHTQENLVLDASAIRDSGVSSLAPDRWCGCPQCTVVAHVLNVMAYDLSALMRIQQNWLLSNSSIH